jgi:hypothetical protein
MKKIYILLRVKKAKISPQSLTKPNEIWGLKSVWSWDISIDRKFYMEQRKYTFEDQKGKISLQSPKTEFGAQNQYGHVTYPSKFYMKLEKIYFCGSKRRN